jgi:MATE family multidrug resistance protein
LGIRSDVMKMWRISYPATVMMLSHTLKHALDTVMVGHLGVSQLAAVGLAGVIIWTLVTFVVGLTDGGTSFIAQSTGAGRHGDAVSFAYNTLWISISAAVPFVVFGASAHWVFRHIVSAPAVQMHAADYARIVLLAHIGPFTYFAAAAYFKGTGDTKTPMKVGILANVVNVALNYVLINGAFGVPALGVEGAAIGTAAAASLEAIVLLSLASKRMSASHGPRLDVRPSLDRLRRLIMVGVPIGISRFVEMAAYSVFSIFIGIAGEIHLAASQVMVQVTAVAFMPGYGVSIGTQALVGQSVGAGRTKQARRFGWIGASMAGTLMGVLGIVFLSVPETLASLFTRDPEVIRLAAICLRIGAIYQILDGVQMGINGALRGAGDTRYPMLVVIITGWLFFVPLTYLLTIGIDWGVVGGWLSTVGYIALLSIAFMRRWRSGRWKAFRLVSDAAEMGRV